MKRQDKHWSEYDRVTKSEWFRNLNETDQAAVQASLESDTARSAGNIRAVLALIYLTMIYAAALWAWGVALNANRLWFVAGGIAVGVVVGGISAKVIASQPAWLGARDAQVVAGAIGGVGILIGTGGLLVYLIRVLLFH